ncbi:jg13832 [Pararge aegeria aegeria]|uniref:Jg13832 protein n=1 Tax=Pararge aegeria aegeria TaxID=348720 RepID=A0A8S4S952_9NEOP|nr:jg13832 [Pararge aegeria aegeria]
MKCAVAIVLALIGMSLANPAPSGLGGLVSPLLLPAVEARSSIVNHGVTIPHIPVVSIIKPLIYEPIIKVPIVKTIHSGWGGHWGGYGLH